VAGLHATAPEDPDAEREPAGAADREQRVRGELRHPDLEARPPPHLGAEHGAEDEHVAEAGSELEQAGDHEPARLRVGEALAQVAEPRHERDHGDDRRRDRGDDQRVAANARGLELLGERIGDRLELRRRQGSGARFHAHLL
jgi:hypothetical protein